MYEYSMYPDTSLFAEYQYYDCVRLYLKEFVKVLVQLYTKFSMYWYLLNLALMRTQGTVEYFS